MIIKELREQLGLSQSGLSLAATIPLDVIQRWEQGRTLLGETKCKYVVKVASTLGTTAESLLKERDGK